MKIVKGKRRPLAGSSFLLIQSSGGASQGMLSAVIASRLIWCGRAGVIASGLGQCGRAEGYVLEGKELEF